MAPSSPNRPCPACDTEVPAGDRFCSACGKPVPEAGDCVKCGAPLPEGGKFCEQCGEPVGPSTGNGASPPAPGGKPRWVIGILMAVMVVLAIGAFTVAGPLLNAGGGSGVTPTPPPTAVTTTVPRTTAHPTATPARTTASPVPIADFTAIPLSGQVPLAVQFTDRSGGNPSSWSWDFGDGSSSTLENPSHTYTFAGTFGVRLTVQGSGGSDTDYRQELVTVMEKVQAPGAAFTASSLSGSAPLSVQFTDRSTGSPALWTWTFGDGSTSSLRNPAHTYTSPGTYMVELTVSGSGGTASARETITVSAPETKAPPTTTSPPVTTTVAPPVIGNFTGGWTTTVEGKPPLTARFNPPAGSSVGGTMAQDSQLLYGLAGTLSPDGRTLEGTWEGMPEAGTGTFRFALDTGGTSFSGTWVENGTSYPATGGAHQI